MINSYIRGHTDDRKYLINAHDMGEDMSVSWPELAQSSHLKMSCQTKWKNGVLLETLFSLSDACFARPIKRCLVLTKVNSNCLNMPREKIIENIRIIKGDKDKDKEKDGDRTENMQTASDASASQQTLSYSVPRKPSLKAEIIWLLYMCQNHLIYRSCDLLPGIFRSCSQIQIAANLLISRYKASCMICDGLGPEFLGLLGDVTKSDMFTLYYDEVTIREGKKQLDLHVRYWSAVTDNVSDVLQSH